MDLNILDSMLARLADSQLYGKIKDDIKKTIHDAIMESMRLSKDSAPVASAGENGEHGGSLTRERIETMLSQPLTDDQFLGAYRVFYHDNPSADFAHAMLSRRDVTARVPKWCFFAIMDLPQKIDCFDFEAIRTYATPMPIRLNAGEDIDFSATVFGWAHDVYLSKIIKDTGRIEPEVQELFKRNIRKGDVVFDIGANIGCHTALASYLSGTGDVYAFEPVPANFGNLSLMVKENDLGNVKLFNYAASSENRSRPIALAEKNISGHSVVTDSVSRPDDDCFINIDCRRLDDEFSHLDRLDFVKIDVEGHEGHVFAGMRNLIEKYRPTLLHEFNPDSIALTQRNPDEILRWLFSLYREAYVPELAERFTDAGALSAVLRERGGYVNIFYSTKGHGARSV